MYNIRSQGTRQWHGKSTPERCLQSRETKDFQLEDYSLASVLLGCEGRGPFPYGLFHNQINKEYGEYIGERKSS